MTGPLAMLITGGIIAKSDMKHILSNIKVWLLCGVRLIIYPALIILILVLLRLDRLMSGFNELALVGFLAAAAPTATSVVQLAKLNNGDYETANAVNILSVLLCVATMPVMVYLYQLALF